MLTSPGQSYVDVRVLDPSVSPCLDAPLSSPAPLASPLRGSSIRRPTADLEWAFAGTSVRSAAAPPEPDAGATEHVDGKLAAEDGNVPTRWRMKWTHWIDSKNIHPEEEVDEGDMEETGPNETSERGSSVHPQTGAVRHYEEIWQDLPVARSKLSLVGTGDSDGRIAIVLVVESVALAARGMSIRVGQYCQGMLRRGDDVSCERWCLLDGQWHCVFKTGEASLPCAVLWEREDLVVGDEIESDRLTWRCEERSIW